jgi:hypothetical protein
MAFSKNIHLQYPMTSIDFTYHQEIEFSINHFFTRAGCHCRPGYVMMEKGCVPEKFSDGK